MSASPFLEESTNLRAFIRSTSTSSAQLVYVPRSTPEMALPCDHDRSATLARPPSPCPPPARLRRTGSFSNLLNLFRRPSLSFSSETLSSRASDSLDLNRSTFADPHIPLAALVETPTAPARSTVPPRSSSLAWLQHSPEEAVGQSDGCSVFTLQLYQDGEDELELRVAAELRETFREWEKRFGLAEGAQEEQVDPKSPTIITSPASPVGTHLQTPASVLLPHSSVQPLRSEFSCDIEDEERGAILDLIRSRNDAPASPRGSIGRLTRKMSSAIALTVAQKSPLGRRLGLGRRDST